AAAGRVGAVWPGMSGAAHLGAAGARRAGAGMVRLATPGLDDAARRPTEAVGLRLPDDGWAEAVSRELHRFRALVVGPGLGTSLATRGGVRLLLGSAPVAAVVDGDGLAADGRDLEDRKSARRGRGEVWAVAVRLLTMNRLYL